MNGLEKAGLKVAKLLHAQGFQAFWVGGFVRNKLLKLQSDNLDIATDALPDQVEQILNKAKIKTKAVGKKFGTILAIVDSFSIEITTFRQESRYSDNRHPDQVQFIKDYLNDAKRRDFTINAFYYDPIKKQLFDPTNGQKDVKLKLLRFVGDPKKRIDEDGLRMLRGVRLATQLGFNLEKNSFAAIKTRAKYIQKVSGERIKAELDKILLSKKPAEGLRLLDQLGLLKFIIPEVEGIKRFSHQSKNYHLEGTIFDHTLIAIDKAKNQNLDLIYALLFHDIGKPAKGKKVLKDEGWVISTKGHAEEGAEIFRKFAKRLSFPRRSVVTIEWLITKHMLMFDFSNMGLTKQIELITSPYFSLLLKHWGYDEGATKRRVYLDDHHKKYLKSLRMAKQLVQKLNHQKPVMEKLARGNLIMKYSKLEPGKELGMTINKIKSQIILGNIKNNQDLKNFLHNNT